MSCKRFIRPLSSLQPLPCLLMLKKAEHPLPFLGNYCFSRGLFFDLIYSESYRPGLIRMTWITVFQGRVFLELGDELDKCRMLCLLRNSVVHYGCMPFKNYSSYKLLLTVQRFGSGVAKCTNPFGSCFCPLVTYVCIRTEHRFVLKVERT